MYQNTVAAPRLDLAGAIRTKDANSDGIAHILFPPFMVRNRTATMPKLLATNGQVFDIKHAPKTAYKRVEAKLGNDTYSCEEAGIEVPLDASDYDVLGQDEAERIATEQGKGIVLTAREAALAAALTGATGESLLAGQITSPTENWGESAGVPIDDVNTADAALSLRIGSSGPRWLVMSQAVLEDLQVNTQIRTEHRRIVGMSKAEATHRRLRLEELAAVLGVDRILVANRQKDTATTNEGVETLAYIWPAEYVLLVRGVTNPSDLTEPALGRMFTWDGANLGAEGELIAEDSMVAMSVESYREESIKADIIRVAEFTHMKVLNTKAAQMIKLPADD